VPLTGPYPFDYEPLTPLDRDQAIKWFRKQARATQSLLKQQTDPRYTPLSEAFEHTLFTLLDRYNEAIQRLAKTMFLKGRATL
jgi:hypothetical protein